MKVKITCYKPNLCRKLREPLFCRDKWNCVSEDGGRTITGSASTISGRCLFLNVAFDEQWNGEGVLTIEAPDSKGGLLQTVMEEIFGNSLYACTLQGERPRHTPEFFDGFTVEIDGVKADFVAVPNDLDKNQPKSYTTWMWTAKTIDPTE